jgi:hypothetical protein
LSANKTYTTPVWWIAIIIFIKIIFSIFYIIQIRDFQALDGSDYGRDIVKRLYINQLISQGVLIIVLLAEAIIYWRIRRRTLHRGLVWVHIGGLLAGFIVIPLLYTAYVAWLSVNSGDGNAGDKISDAILIQKVFIGVCLVVGHTCFILLLIDTFKKRRKQESEPPASDSLDILNDYA